MGTSIRARQGGAHHTAPLGPLLLCSCISAAVCIVVLAWQAVSLAVRHLPQLVMNWSALALTGALAAVAELVSRIARVVGHFWLGGRPSKRAPAACH